MVDFSTRLSALFVSGSCPFLRYRYVINAHPKSGHSIALYTPTNIPLPSPFAFMAPNPTHPIKGI